ncbi:MAG: response regulator, partial [Lachnospiraceae bacterium]|nr:response regulator [Lachnospiraceae bacterium]
MFKAPGKRVLVVDDTKVNLLVFKGLLRDTEITIDSASSGAEGIELTKKNKYDIIFM